MMQGIDIALKNGEQYHISGHALERMRERLRMKKSAAIRLCKKALESGEVIHQSDDSRTIEYGLIQYILCGATIVTVYSRDMLFLRKKYLAQRSDLMRMKNQAKSKKRKKDGVNKVTKSDIRYRSDSDTYSMMQTIDDVASGKRKTEVKTMPKKKTKLQKQDDDNKCRQNLLNGIRNYLRNGTNTEGFWEEVLKIKEKAEMEGQ